MASFHSERPQYELHNGKGHVRLDRVLQRDLLALIGPGGLVVSHSESHRTYAIEGVTGIVFAGQLYPEGTFIIQTEGRDDMGEVVNEWIQNYFNGEQGIYASRKLTEDALRKYGRHTTNRLE